MKLARARTDIYCDTTVRFQQQSNAAVSH